MTAEKPTALLLGDASALRQAYPENLLGEISEKVRILEPCLTAESWREQTGLLTGTDVILSSWGMPCLNRDFLSHATRLRAVFYAAGTVKSFVTPEFFERGITISNASKANAIPVAEYALAAILLSLKRFWQHARTTRQSQEWKRLSVPGAYRAVVGLVSLGAVGRLTAEKLKGFELEVLAMDPLISPGQAAALGVTLVDLAEIFTRSDVVSLHVPWLPETENLICASLLRRMKPGATLINTSRGAVVHEAELCTVLRERPDLTAILDVTHPEPPLSDSPLFKLGNVILTPHISGSMDAEVSRMGRWMFEELDRFLQGAPLQHVITREMLSTSG